MLNFHPGGLGSTPAQGNTQKILKITKCATKITTSTRRIIKKMLNLLTFELKKLK